MHGVGADQNVLVSTEKLDEYRTAQALCQYKWLENSDQGRLNLFYHPPVLLFLHFDDMLVKLLDNYSSHLEILKNVVAVSLMMRTNVAYCDCLRCQIEDGENNVSVWHSHLIFVGNATSNRIVCIQTCEY